MRLATITSLLIATALFTIDAVPYQPYEIKLTTNDREALYGFPISFFQQKFMVLFDTGSSDLWVPEKTCATCGNKAKFDPDEDYDFQTDHAPFEITYGTLLVNGYIGTSDFNLGVALVPDQIFGLTTMISQEFNGFLFDGIIGFGLNENSKMGASTPFSILVEKDLIAFGRFSVYLGRNRDGNGDRSNLYIGGEDNTKFSGDINFNPVVTADGRWTITLGGVSVNGGRYNFQPKGAIIDTGSSHILIPLADLRSIIPLIPRARVGPPVTIRTGVLYPVIFPCANPVDFVFTFGEISYTVDSLDILGEPIPNTDLCRSRIAGAVLEKGEVWVMGTSFLKNVYTVFDTADVAIGFANLAVN